MTKSSVRCFGIKLSCRCTELIISQYSYPQPIIPDAKNICLVKVTIHRLKFPYSLLFDQFYLWIRTLVISKMYCPAGDKY